jgi:acyl-CoA dehydrogenase family protein 9
MAKIAGSEFHWYAVNRVFQLLGGKAYMADSPAAKALRDSRVFPIFEGSNDVLRAFVAPSGLKAVADEVADRVAEQVGQLRATAEKPLRIHGRDIRPRQRQQKRIAHALIDIYGADRHDLAHHRPVRAAGGCRRPGRNATSPAPSATAQQAG